MPVLTMFSNLDYFRLCLHDANYSILTRDDTQLPSGVVFCPAWKFYSKVISELYNNKHTVIRCNLAHQSVEKLIKVQLLFLFY